MLGALAGDIIGSVHEHGPPVPKDFILFVAASRCTDDSVLTVATADALIRGEPFDAAYRQWGRRYPDAGYGGMFQRWLHDDAAGPYRSFGNGSAMRVAPVAWACNSLDDVLTTAARSAAVTHDHPEGIRGAQAIAAAIWIARHGATRDDIAQLITTRFGYPLDATLDELRARAVFDVTCQGTVPAAVTAFLAGDSFEDAVRNAVSLGGDADTLACICGALAEPFHGGVPAAIRAEVLARIDPPQRAVVDAFARAHAVPLPAS